MINRGPQGRRTDGREGGREGGNAKPRRSRRAFARQSPPPSPLRVPREQMRKDECREGGKEKRLFIPTGWRKKLNLKYFI